MRWLLAMLALSFAVQAGGILKPYDVVAVFGDSNTEWGDYPELLNEFYSRQFPQKKIKFLNKGVAGLTTQLAYWGYLDIILESKPTVLILVLGVNDIDVGYEKRAHVLAEYKKYYLEGIELIIRQANYLGIRTVVVSYPPTNPEIPLLQEWSLEAGALAERMGQRFLDLHSAMAKRSEPIHREDGFHLNALGNQVLAEELFRLLTKD